ncbi:MAG TPA: FecR domain-containing protein [Puia sp.]|nr:FecR domain-containing protein [Puia sp.]
MMTRETREHIQFLLIQYLEDKASPGEREQLSQYLLAAGEEELWMEMMEELMITEPPLSGYDPLDWQPFIEELKQKNAAAAAVQVIPAGRNYFLQRSRWWAVAAILLLLISGAWLWVLLNRQSPAASVNTEQPVTADVLPGGNRATLTLAGGRQIILDSAANGLLTHQGNTQIQKLANGRLAYQPINEKPSSVVYNTLSTPRGGQYQLTLPDGTRVWLNAASSITYPVAFTGAERTIKITGEAYLEVSHNSHLPFRVQAGDQLIEDIGTAFNVNAYADEPAVRTTLVEGKVKVSRGAAVRLLSPGQQVRSRGGELEMVPGADVEEALAWKKGAFAFRDADLPTVMRQLARWYDIDVEYTGPVPGGTFDGEIGRSLTLKQVLQGLAQTRIHYTIVNEHKLVIRP